MSSSKIIQLFHFVNNRVQCKIYIFMFTFIFMFLTFVFIPGDILYAWGQNEYNVYLLNKTVKKGTRPKINVSDDEFVLRSLAVDRLKKILQPNRNHSCYHVVCGEHETGKTTLIRSASREVGQGIIYVEIPADAEDIEDFGMAFGKSLNFAFEERFSLCHSL
ncbi:hypothetical protein GLOIN_2v1711197 [Rhizophagus irregularis DAOM 181602=DAOM 197198]|uniref:ATPase AAA-type core domain-containing protein n=1 Tax=Rhizophagus irregularis (strain DAOM 181602 / DAOM 197198 / MUCL 43194) TaxID=747089 RepID=A0A2P4P5I9_RHIID|nr:hypothetical protein GLOIN_2v1711197 [Rhizophagus irregularis DAOM 181602=DAOM 197198]POG60648.1 hypothetical protein GLOIN_2v1711197 [Rhizophagus irregularis DAOM 181602=DAOM 197198]|eukprot:XP_025167514.1 hypothetical protein GLOIN_2v1711197 [Rhizophagus irregularis DAOM 181602=DAOM 197198]